ncbi:MAG: hypothetical protein ABW065_00335 [Solirubrobacterales bacterium]
MGVSADSSTLDGVRRLGALAGVLLVLLVAVAPAGATVRFAASGASGKAPCNPAPCSLGTALTVAVAGDEVVLAPGSYLEPNGLKIAKAISFGGLPGQAPTLRTGSDPFEVESPAAIVHDLRIELSEPTMGYPLYLSSGTVERVYADPAGLGGQGCFMETGTLRDSVCRDGIFVSFNQPKSVVANLVNVTANPVVIGSNGGATMNANLINTVALPVISPFTSKSGLLIDASMGSVVKVTARNSNYNSVDSSLSSGAGFTYTPAGSNGNQTAPPQFVAADSGDFRQLPTSPTVDAGASDSLLVGALDLLGAPRVLPRCIGGPPAPDIGAYELVPTELCPGSGGDAGGGGGGGRAPTAPTAPSNEISLGRLERHPGKGTATLVVSVPGPGTVVLGGKGVVGRQLTARKAETLKLLVKAKSRKARKLVANGKVKLRPTITFAPFGGSAATTPRPLTLKLNPSAHASR